MQQVLVGVGGVDDQQKPVFLILVQVSVVHSAAPLVGDDAVLGPSGNQSRRVAGQHFLQERQPVRALHNQTAHVGHIENATVPAIIQVLRHDSRGILNGHLPAAEIHHGRSCRHMGIVKRGALQFTHIGCSFPNSIEIPAVSRMAGTFFSAPMAMIWTPEQRFSPLILPISSAAI